MGADNITLDCGGHTIDGTDQGWPPGISLVGRSWDTIENCVVTDFAYGVYLSGSNNNTLTGNTARSNVYDGIAFLGNGGNANTLTGNTTRDNGDNGVFLAGSDNTLTGSTIRDNLGNGVLVYYGGSNNTIYNNTVRNNAGTGVGVLAAGSNNALNSNVVCSNKLDISNTGSNYGDDNTCESTDNWDDTGTEGCTFACPVEPVCYCSSCSECNEKLAADCPVVKLTADIVDQSGTCINQERTFNGEVFDCQGHTIDGTDQGWPPAFR